MKVSIDEERIEVPQDFAIDPVCNDCTKCIYYKVCKYEQDYTKAVLKLGKMRTFHKGPFAYSLDCDHFQEDRPTPRPEFVSYR